MKKIVETEGKKINFIFFDDSRELFKNTEINNKIENKYETFF